MAAFRNRLLDDMANEDLPPEDRLSAIRMYWFQYNRLQRLLRPKRMRAYEWDDDRARAAIKFLDEVIEGKVQVLAGAPARTWGRKNLKRLRDRVHRCWAGEAIATAKGLRRSRRRGKLTL